MPLIERFTRFEFWLRLSVYSIPITLVSWALAFIKLFLRSTNVTHDPAGMIVFIVAITCLTLTAVFLLTSLCLYVGKNSEFSFVKKLYFLTGGVGSISITCLFLLETMMQTIQALLYAFNHSHDPCFLSGGVSTPDPSRPGTFDCAIIMRGRPHRIGGKVHVSKIEQSKDWTLNRNFSNSLHDWLEPARGEHSSVAAFAKLSLELGQLGCPPELLAGAHQAALDEINHAQVAFTLDSANDGTPKGPAAEKGFFGEAGHMFRLHKMALDTFKDGCLHEARSALALKKCAGEEPDAAIRAEIERIWSEEQTHVELAWKIVRWCFRELKQDAHRARLFRQLTAVLEASAKREEGDAEKRGIFEQARVALNEIYSAAA